MHRTSWKRTLCALAAATGLGCALAPAAWADGDPASDVLSTQSVYYPYQPKVSPALRLQLEALLRRVRADGLKIKVALIATPADLGTQTKRFDKPRSYAELLGLELEITSVHDYVLVSMPAGLGTYRYDERGLPVLRQAIAAIPGPGRQDSDGLALSAGRGLVAIARASGHPVPASLSSPFVSNGGGATSRGTRDAILVLALLGFAAALAIAFRVRARRAPAPPSPSRGEPVAAVGRDVRPDLERDLCVTAER